MSIAARQQQSNSSLKERIDEAFASIPHGDTCPSAILRAIEIVVAATALLITFPIQLWMGWLIRRGSPGPALFRQDRIGMNGKLFKFVKFRTLYADARQRWPEMYAYDFTPDQVEMLMYKAADDPRVTPQGRWMRFSSLDELPNFWNVLKGDVALVGPRPEIPEMLPYYRTHELRKFSVRPGITGLAQVSGRSRLSFQETVALDLEYVNRRTLLLDIKILLTTLLKIVTRDGAF